MLKRKAKAKKLVQVLVNRKKWYRGKGDEYSRLLRDDGKMCCLGFVGLALGATTKQLKGVSCPSDVDNTDIWAQTKLMYCREDSSVCGKLMEVNDEPVGDSIISEKQRESMIRQLGQRAGIAFKFTG